MNFAPKMPTIIVALALMLIGLLGTFTSVVPDVGGIRAEVVGAWSLVLAAAVLLLGMVFEGI